jgi:hypothetical protein
MKKTTLLVLASFVLFCTVNAQDGFKQAAGDKSLEFKFAPLGGNPVGISGIQFKSYSSETSALRLNIFIGKTGETTITQQGVDTAVAIASRLLELKDVNSTLEIGLRPGIEKHFKGTDRLSPYIGAELDIAKKFGTKKEDSQYNGKNNDSPKVYTKKTSGEDGFLRLGVNAVAGFDYFIAKKLFLGAELGFGISYNKKSTIKIKDPKAETIATDGNVTYHAPLDQKQGSTFNLGPNVNAQIRLGYMF